MISSVFKSFCNSTNLLLKDGGQCENISVFANQDCFMIMPGQFKKFYEEQFKNEIFKIITEIRGFFIHIWNKMLTFNGKNYTLDYESKSAYMELAKVYCPNVVETRIIF